MNDLLDGPVGLLLMFAAIWIVGRIIDSISDTVRDLWAHWKQRRKSANPPQKKQEPPRHHNGFDHPA